MESVALGTTGRQTSRLGFGCSSVASLGSRAKGMALLETAYAAGVRHFDVAPLYGDGAAENLLGEFLATHRTDITVATKFGIPPGRTPPVKKLAQTLLRPVMASFPGLKRRLQRGVPAPATEAMEAGPNPIFNAAEASASLVRSLRSLRVERIDVWLLHEARRRDLEAPGADGLLRMMEDAVAAGKVGMFGVGSDHKDLLALQQSLPAFVRCTQSEWSVLSQPEPQTPGIFRMHHRALSANFAEVAERLRSDTAQCRAWSEEIGADLRDADLVARLMLKAACVLNPASVILFSSKRASHVQTNAATVADDTLTEPARRLYLLAQRELVR